MKALTRSGLHAHQAGMPGCQTITEELRIRLELTVPRLRDLLEELFRLEEPENCDWTERYEARVPQRLRYALSCWTYRLTSTSFGPSRKQAVARTLRVTRKE